MNTELAQKLAEMGLGKTLVHRDDDGDVVFVALRVPRGWLMSGQDTPAVFVPMPSDKYRWSTW